MPVKSEAVTLKTDDGLSLGATCWRATTTARGFVLIASATGVPHRYYRHFAEHLARAGFDSLSWDWRGIASSRAGLSMRDPRLTMRNWGERDFAAAIAWAEGNARGVPISVVGHSFGGQALGLAPNAQSVTRAFFVASQHGWRGHWPTRYQPTLFVLWKMLMPALATVMGRFPSSWFGFGEDLPREVAREWALWCGRPQHMGTWEGHAQLRIPLLSLSFEDDSIAPEHAAAALVREYRQADSRHIHEPATGLEHFGYFRPERGAARWPEAVEFLSGGA